MTPSQSTAAPVSGSEGVEGVSVGVEGVSEGVEGTGGTGAPGVGKSMLAARLPGILPKLDMHEAVEVAASRAGDGRVI